jgi:hypothetical protein
VVDVRLRDRRRAIEDEPAVRVAPDRRHRAAVRTIAFPAEERQLHVGERFPLLVHHEPADRLGRRLLRTRGRRPGGVGKRGRSGPGGITGFGGW